MAWGAVILDSDLQQTYSQVWRVGIEQNVTRSVDDGDDRYARISVEVDMSNPDSAAD